MENTNSLVIFYDDLTDSDNWAAAKFLLQACQKSRSRRIVFIIEPRQISLGLSMTPAQIEGCKKLIAKHFPTLEKPIKVLLAGLLEPHHIDEIHGLTADDRNLVRSSRLSSS